MNHYESILKRYNLSIHFGFTSTHFFISLNPIRVNMIAEIESDKW